MFNDLFAGILVLWGVGFLVTGVIPIIYLVIGAYTWGRYALTGTWPRWVKPGMRPAHRPGQSTCRIRVG